MKAKQNILLCSADKELHSALEKQLPASYQLLLATNGLVGLQKAMEIQPDIIVSQQELAQKDGLQLCYATKYDSRTRETPFILLTKTRLTKNYTTGLEQEPDILLEWPYTVEEICEQVYNLLGQEQQVSKEIKLQPSFDGDQEFAESVQKIIREHLTDALFGVDEFAELLNMSRMQLHRKTTSTFSLSPGVLIRKLRLKQAAQLLKTTELSISEISYQTGFSQASYFAKCFKKEYSCSPNEYRH